MPRKRKNDPGLVLVEGTEFGKRPAPPEGLTPEQAEIWRATAASGPEGVFGTAAARAVLVDYCRHRATANTISAVIDAIKPATIKTADGVKRYRELLKTRDTECRAASAAATKLRITNQSRYTPGAANTQSKKAVKAAALPWDFDG